MLKKIRRPAATPALALALMLALAACDEGGSITGNGPGDTPAFSREIGLSDLESAVTGGEQRLEIKLVPGSLVAREVEIERPEELSDEEKIEAKITDITAAGGSGTLTLAIDGLEVQFNSSTEFRSEEGSLTFDQFVTRVEDALGAGGHPPVEAKRPSPSEPQAPEDGTFLATRLKLDDESGEPKIEIKVDDDNLALNPSPGAGDPDGLIKVLGLEIELRVSEGLTDLEEETEDASGSSEFEGLVASVTPDPGSNTTGVVELADQTIIRVVTGTEIEGDSDGDDDDDEHLTTFSQVQAALDAGQLVEADGEGVLEDTDPRTFTAIEIEFEIEDDADDIPGAVEFESTVAEVDVGGGTITLANNTVVRITDDVIDGEGDLLTLQAVADALGGPQPIRVEGHAEVESVGPPAVLVALTAKFEIDDN